MAGIKIGTKVITKKTAPARIAPGGRQAVKNGKPVAQPAGKTFTIKALKSKNNVVWASGGQYFYNVAYLQPAPTGRTTLKGTPLPKDVVWHEAANVPFRGRRACSCVTQVVGLAEALLIERGEIKHSLDFYQLCWSTAVPASAGTHDHGGCGDVVQTSDAVVQALREAGSSAWRRTRDQGFNPVHIHFDVIGCPHMAPIAAGQVRSYLAGRNGLANGAADYHRRPKPVRTYRAAVAALTKDW